MGGYFRGGSQTKGGKGIRDVHEHHQKRIESYHCKPVWYLKEEWARYRITDWFGLDGTLKLISFQASAMGLVLRISQMTLFQYGLKRGFLTAPKDLLCPVGRSLAPGPSLKDQLCCTINFTVIMSEPQFPPHQTSSTRSSPDSFSVSSTCINSSYPAVHLCSWATPCPAPAQLLMQKGSRDWSMWDLSWVFLQPAQIPNYLGWHNAEGIQKVNFTRWNHRR